MTRDGRLASQSREVLCSSRFGAKCHWDVSGVDQFGKRKFAARYACWQRKRCRRAINRLANAQVTTRRWVAPTVAGGMRLIEEGFLDEGSVTELADSLGMGGVGYMFVPPKN